MTSGSIQIPDGAKGREGMLVALRKVKDLDDGRLAIVKHAVGWVGSLLGTTRSVFAWQVLLTGEPVRIHGQLNQEIIVADACLCPVSQFAQEDALALVQQHEQDEVAAAAAQVRSMLGPKDLGSPELDKAMHQAFGQALLRHALEVVGVEMALIELGFWPSNPPHGQTYQWKSVFNGQEIQMDAAPGMFGDWRIWVHSSSARKIFGAERLVLNDWPRGRAVQMVLELWESVFGNSKIPQQFEQGWLFRQHQQDMRSLEPATPYVLVKGEDLRRALRWLREAFAESDLLEGPAPDVVLSLEIKDGDLRMRTEQFDIGVRVLRGWIDACDVSLRTLLKVPPALVRGAWVVLRRSGDEIDLAGHCSPAFSKAVEDDKRGLG